MIPYPKGKADIFYPVTMAILLLIFALGMSLSFWLQADIDEFLHGAHRFGLMLGVIAVMTCSSYSFQEIRHAVMEIFVLPVERIQGAKVDYFWHCMIRNTLLAGAVANSIGSVKMLQNLNDPEQIAVVLRYIMQPVFFAILLSLLIFIPVILYNRIRNRRAFRSSNSISAETRRITSKTILTIACVYLLVIASIFLDTPFRVYIDVPSLLIFIGFILLFQQMYSGKYFWNILAFIIFISCICIAFYQEYTLTWMGIGLLSAFLILFLGLTYLCKIKSENVWAGYVGVAVLMSLSGAVIGYTKMILSTHDPDTIGPSFATALLTNFYSILFLIGVYPLQDITNISARYYKEICFSRLVWIFLPVTALIINQFGFVIFLIALGIYMEDKNAFMEFIRFYESETGNPIVLSIIWILTFIGFLIGFGISQFLLVNRNYTLLQQTQAQLLQSEKMAALGQLVAGVAHEINNPVNFIRSNVAPLRQYFSGFLRLSDFVERNRSAFPEADRKELDALIEKEDLEYIKEDSENLVKSFEEGSIRIANIVSDLRNYARTDKEYFSPTDLNERIDSTLNLLKSKWKKGIRIHKKFGAIPPVNCSPGQIGQVLMNVLANAMEALDDSGTIWITTQQEKHQVVIVIQDDGPGIPKDLQTKIFDPFFTTKPVGSGTGLGLSITYSLIEQHQGRITVESEEGRGTAFRITLPIVSS